MSPNKRDYKDLKWTSQYRVLQWYRRRCQELGISNCDLVKMHSFRIAGATALFAAGLGPEHVKNAGRWDSETYEIYCRLCEGLLLDMSVKMSNADISQWVSRDDGFFDALAGTAMTAEDDEPVTEESESDASDDEPEPSDGSDSDEAPKARSRGRPPARPAEKGQEPKQKAQASLPPKLSTCS